MQKTKAFTLVELIIVIAIIAIISAVSWSVLGGAKKTAAVNDACNQVAAMINKTRNYALSGKNGANFFEITTKPSGLAIIIKADANTLETFVLAGGVICDTDTVLYAAPNGEAQFNGHNFTTESINCSSSDFSASRTVSVSPYTAVCQ